MPFQFRTVQLGSPYQPGEGLRIGTVRFPPRGVPKNEYRERDLFDVWLPTLAPSRELLKSFRAGKLGPHAFSQKYRSEMARTVPRQTIQLIAELAKSTPVSVGCFCAKESRCHRTALGELIRQAAGEPANQLLSKQAVYTIAHPETLRQLYDEENGYGSLPEGKRWTTAVSLWHDAQICDETLPIVFADATDCSRLIYWARVSSINVEDDGTRYSFSGLKKIPGSHSPQELVLTHTGAHIAPGFIRPYALVRTPKFLR